ncbi:MAG: hypothetical protein M1541_07550 [Acidobacteria bacterium]|nr:hypothetical protein [Acidobacteriota bacterium]
MSKLTNCQIKAQIQGLEASIAGAVQRGDAAGARRREKKLAGYRAEVAEREARALNLGTEIQADTLTGGSTPLKGGNRVFILPPHPWAGHAGELIAYETYGMGWQGWRIKLDGNCGECYASESELMGPARVDSIRMSGRRRGKGR